MRSGLTFDDVLIVPKYSDVASRTEIDVTSPYFADKRRLPIISAPMDYVTGIAMAKRLHELGAYGIINRFGEETPAYYPNHQFGIAVGVNTPWNEIGAYLYLYGTVHSVCIDVAHGDHQKVVDLIKRLRDYGDDSFYIIAGNVATDDGFYRLEQAGASAIRVGIGAGSACSTRENTGIGVPQLTAIMDCAQVATTASLIADGGIQTPGDIAKALAAGADAVMLGKMLAGHDETPGDVTFSPVSKLPDGGFAYDYVKPYRGQSIFGSNAARGAPEGVEGTVPYRGPVDKTVESLVNYLKSSFSYVGARNIEEFRQNAELIQVSPATAAENRTRL